MTDIEISYDWSCFLRLMAEEHPEIEVPKRGCTEELRQIMDAHNLWNWLYDTIRTAPGDRAWVIYRACSDGWWPRDEAVADIRTAPGDRAMAIYYARRDGWWPRDDTDGFESRLVGGDTGGHGGKRRIEVIGLSFTFDIATEFDLPTIKRYWRPRIIWSRHTRQLNIVWLAFFLCVKIYGKER